VNVHGLQLEQRADSVVDCEALFGNGVDCVGAERTRELRFICVLVNTALADGPVAWEEEWRVVAVGAVGTVEKVVNLCVVVKHRCC